MDRSLEMWPLATKLMHGGAIMKEIMTRGKKNAHLHNRHLVYEELKYLNYRECGTIRAHHIIDGLWPSSGVVD